MVFKVIEDIKNIQANDALMNAQARQKALGYNQKSISVCENSCSAIAPPLVVANKLFDRGQKRKTSGPVKASRRKK